MTNESRRQAIIRALEKALKAESAILMQAVRAGQEEAADGAAFQLYNIIADLATQAGKL